MAMMSIADALKSAIAEEMRTDSSVYCLGEDEDIPGGMLLKLFSANALCCGCAGLTARKRRCGW